MRQTSYEKDARDDLQGLIFATSNLPYLRGLTIVPLGLWMASFPFLGRLTRGYPIEAAGGSVLATVVAALATWRINRYYDRRYGRVQALNKKRVFPLAGMAFWSAVYGVLVGRAEYGVPALALWWAAFFFGIYMSSAGYRWSYLVVAGALAALMPWWVQLRDYQWLVLGFAFAVTGLMDHLLLRKLLPERDTGEAAASAI